MENFEFENPTKILFGKGKIEQIGVEIKKRGINKVLILFGGGSIYKNGVYKQVESSLKKNKIDCVEFGGIKPNPVLSKVHEAIGISRENKVEAILAVGGGSVIDSAKVIASGFYFQGDIWDIFEGKAKPGKALPVFTVLTISATGSEMNPYAVITKENELKKWAFPGNINNYPKVSVIDPAVQMSLPKEQTIYGAVDAMSHIFELYFSGEHVELMDAYSEALLRSIMTNVLILLEYPKNYSARAELAWAATLALNGTNAVGRGGGDWSSHVLEHSISAYYDIAHGAGLAIVFPAWMQYVFEEDLPKWERFAKTVFKIYDGSPKEKAEKSIRKLKDFYKRIGAPTSMSQIGVEEADLDKLAENAAMNAPVGKLKHLFYDDIYQIYSLAMF